MRDLPLRIGKKNDSPLGRTIRLRESVTEQTSDLCKSNQRRPAQISAGQTNTEPDQRRPDPSHCNEILHCHLQDIITCDGESRCSPGSGKTLLNTLRHRKDKHFRLLLGTPGGAYLASSCQGLHFKTLTKGFRRVCQLDDIISLLPKRSNIIVTVYHVPKTPRQGFYLAYKAGL